MLPLPAFTSLIPVNQPPHLHPLPCHQKARSYIVKASVAKSYFPYQSPNFVPLSNSNPSTPPPSLSSLTSPPHSIHLLASDLDGTLLNPSKNIDEANIEAVISLIQSGVMFVPATGKSRVGAIRAMGKLGSFLEGQDCRGLFPGIFLNGLLVYGKNGEIVWEKGLEKKAADVILKEAEKRGLVVLFYSGDRLLVRERRVETDMFIVSHEPVPESVGDLAEILKGTFVHKALLVDPSGNVVQWRKELEVALDGAGVITQARPDVLEVLPVGGGKGDGFRKLLEDLEVDKKCAMAIGDGENDLDMIQEAGFGVAVANAVPEMLVAADEIVCGNGEAAVAYAIRKFIMTSM